MRRRLAVATAGFAALLALWRASGIGDLPPDADPRGLPRLAREPRRGVRRAADVGGRPEPRRRPRPARLRRLRWRDRRRHLPGRRARGANQSTLVLATPAAEAAFGFAADARNVAVGTARSRRWSGLLGIDRLRRLGQLQRLPAKSRRPARRAGGDPGRHGPAAHDRPGLRRPCSSRPTTTTTAPPTSPPSSRARARTRWRRPSTPARAAAAPAAPRSFSAGRARPSGAPQTSLGHKPPKRSHDRTPTFRFDADEAGASFECRVDKRRVPRLPLAR